MVSDADSEFLDAAKQLFHDIFVKKPKAKDLLSGISWLESFKVCIAVFTLAY